MTKKFAQVSSLSLLTIAMAACSNQTLTPSEGSFKSTLISDVRTVCKEVSQNYVYFEERAIHWNDTCERAKKEVSLLERKSGALSVFERMVDDLYDPHISLNTNNQNSPRLVPSGSDIWFDKIEDNFIVSAVRPLSGAAKAGIEIGDQLVRFNGLTPDAVARTRIHSGTADLAEERIIWALNAAVAGKRSDPRNIDIRRGDDVLSFAMGAPEVPQRNEPISYDVVSEGGGYIRFNNSLSNPATVSAFNEALNDLRQTNGLIIDLRGTPGGGNTSVAEPILGRFISKRTAYQRTVSPTGTKIDRIVKPSGPWTYEKPIVVLVGRWTGSMGEGMAIGFDGMGRASVMGSKMAGLAGGTEAIKLKETGLELRLPTYDLRHLDDTPRHNWKPSEISVADNGAQEDELLRKAIFILEKNKDDF